MALGTRGNVTDRHRLPAVIESVDPKPVDNDHGGWDVRITLDYFDGGHQSLAGWHVDKKVAEDALREICELFDVKRPQDLVGKKCYGLKYLGGFNEYLCGLENMLGERFIVRKFLRERYPENRELRKSKLQEEEDSIKSDIAHLQRRIKEREADLVRLPFEFVDWEKQ
jgi:hypothetical protein